MFKNDFENSVNNENMITQTQNTCSINAPLPGIIYPPVYECPTERICHRQICHEVPQV